MILTAEEQDRLEYLHNELRAIHGSEVDDDTDFDAWVEEQANDNDAQDKATAAEYLALAHKELQP